MKADEALEWAADYAARSKLFEAPVKSNGYPVDGWKNPTPQERLDVILKLAATVTDDAKASFGEVCDLMEGIASKCAHGYVICAPCDHVPSSWRVRP